MTALYVHHKAFLKKYGNIFVCLLLFVFTSTVYWQVKNHDFINLDDKEYITGNQYVQDGLTVRGVVWAFTSVHCCNWHPLTWISHMLDCEIYGINPGMHHLTNLIFHIANTILLYFVFRRMTGCLWKSAFIAALFSLHPLHVESVAWVSERKDVLSTFFWMLATLSYIEYVRHKGVYRYLSVTVFFILGLMSKPMLVTLPFVFLLLDYYPLNRFCLPSDKKGSTQKTKALNLVFEKLPLFIIMLISCGVTFYAQKTGGAVAPLDFIPVYSRIGNALVSYVLYIYKMILPYNLAVLYPYPGILPWWKIAGSCILIISISFWAIRVSGRFPFFIVGWLWYLGTLVPVIGLVQVGSQALADRYTYIPLIGIFFIISWGVPEIVKGWKHRNIFLSASAAATLSTFGIITFIQAGYWENSITLYNQTLSVTTDNYITYKNLGLALFDEGHVDDAIKHYRESLKINPYCDETHNYMGFALFHQGYKEESIKHYREALRINPGHKSAHNNLGVSLQEQGYIDEALLNYKEALRINPDLEKAHYNLANVLKEQGRTDEAINHYKAVLRIKPDSGEAHNNLGLIFQQQGRINEAVKHFKAALHINPDLDKTHYNLGNILKDQGRINEAIKHYKQALTINSDSEAVHNDLGLALKEQGRLNNAVFHYKEALRINPDSEEANYNLGVALQDTGHIDDAIQHYREVLRINPDFEKAHYNLGVALQKQGYIDESIKHYKTALRIKPGYEKVYNNFAIALFQKGDVEGAISLFQEVLQMNPDNTSARKNLERVLAFKNNKK